MTPPDTVELLQCPEYILIASEQITVTARYSTSTSSSIFLAGYFRKTGLGSEVIGDTALLVGPGSDQEKVLTIQVPVLLDSTATYTLVIYIAPISDPSFSNRLSVVSCSGIKVALPADKLYGATTSILTTTSSTRTITTVADDLSCITSPPYWMDSEGDDCSTVAFHFAVCEFCDYVMQPNTHRL